MVDILVPAMSMPLHGQQNCSSWINLIIKRGAVDWADSENIPTLQCTAQVRCISLSIELPYLYIQLNVCSIHTDYLFCIRPVQIGCTHIQGHQPMCSWLAPVQNSLAPRTFQAQSRGYLFYQISEVVQEHFTKGNERDGKHLMSAVGSRHTDLMV